VWASSVVHNALPMFVANVECAKFGAFFLANEVLALDGVPLAFLDLCHG